MFQNQRHKSLPGKIMIFILTFSFVTTSVITPAVAQTLLGILNLPVPGTMMTLTPAYQPIMLKGLTIHPENPLQMDFVIAKGEERLDDDAFNDESTRLVKYFLAALTTPEEEMWVNLSPYEQDRIVTDSFGDTIMGRDLLAQDYLLKQLSASLMYPESGIGSDFWKRVRERTYKKFGTTDIPMNTFNKIWIVPEKAVVYTHKNHAFVVESHLKVMLEEDYFALNKFQGGQEPGTGDARLSHSASRVPGNMSQPITGVSLEIVREVMLPEIEKEINTGKTFAPLRQIYTASILADWYKTNLKESLLGQAYVDQSKTAGIDTDDKQINQKIYEQYVESFRKGVYDYIKEDYDAETDTVIPRKYFSGGAVMASDHATVTGPELTEAQDHAMSGQHKYVKFVLEPTPAPLPRETASHVEPPKKSLPGVFIPFQKIREAASSDEIVGLSTEPIVKEFLKRLETLGNETSIQFILSEDRDAKNRELNFFRELNRRKIIKELNLPSPASSIRLEFKDYRYVAAGLQAVVLAFSMIKEGEQEEADSIKALEKVNAIAAYAETDLNSASRIHISTQIRAILQSNSIEISDIRYVLDEEISDEEQAFFAFLQNKNILWKVVKFEPSEENRVTASYLYLRIPQKNHWAAVLQTIQIGLEMAEEASRADGAMTEEENKARTALVVQITEMSLETRREWIQDSARNISYTLRELLKNPHLISFEENVMESFLRDSKSITTSLEQFQGAFIQASVLPQMIQLLEQYMEAIPEDVEAQTQDTETAIIIQKVRRDISLFKMGLSHMAKYSLLIDPMSIPLLRSIHTSPLMEQFQNALSSRDSQDPLPEAMQSLDQFPDQSLAGTAYMFYFLQEAREALLQQSETSTENSNEPEEFIKEIKNTLSEYSPFFQAMFALLFPHKVIEAEELDQTAASSFYDLTEQWDYWHMNALPRVSGMGVEPAEALTVLTTMRGNLADFIRNGTISHEDQEPLLFWEESTDDQQNEIAAQVYAHLMLTLSDDEKAYMNASQQLPNVSVSSATEAPSILGHIDQFISEEQSFQKLQDFLNHYALKDPRLTLPFGSVPEDNQSTLQQEIFSPMQELEESIRTEDSSVEWLAFDEDAEIQFGQSARFYAEKVVQADWYQANLAFDLDPIIAKIATMSEEERRNVVIVDASAGTGGAALYILNALRALNKILEQRGEPAISIGKIILTDVDYPNSRSFMNYAYTQIQGKYTDVVAETQFGILPRLKKQEGIPVFQRVDSISGLQADFIVMENAVHLIPETQLPRLFESFKNVLKAGGQLILGTGDVPDFREDGSPVIGIHDMFAFTREKLFEILKAKVTKTPLEEALIANRNNASDRIASFPEANSVDVITGALAQAGFSVDKNAVNLTHQVKLDGNDYAPFITDIEAYVKAYILPEFKAVVAELIDKKAELTAEQMKKMTALITEEMMELVKEAYTAVLRDTPSGYQLGWAKFEATTEVETDAAMTPIEKADRLLEGFRNVSAPDARIVAVPSQYRVGPAADQDPVFLANHNNLLFRYLDIANDNVPPTSANENIRFLKVLMEHPLYNGLTILEREELVFAYIKQATGVSAPLRAYHEAENKATIASIPRIAEEMDGVEGSENRLKRGIQLALAGNRASSASFRSAFENNSMPKEVPSYLDGNITLFRDDSQALIDEMLDQDKRTVMYIFDNMIETGYDLMPLRELQKLGKKLILVAKGEEADNDATVKYVQDLLDRTGFDQQNTKLIASGSLTRGFDLRRATDAFIRAWISADIILIKGEGNYLSFVQPGGLTKDVFALANSKAAHQLLGIPQGLGVIEKIPAMSDQAMMGRRSFRNTHIQDMAGGHDLEAASRLTGLNWEALSIRYRGWKPAGILKDVQEYLTQILERSGLTVEALFVRYPEGKVSDIWEQVQKKFPDPDGLPDDAMLDGYTDAAMAAPGGIDLDPDLFDLEVRGDGALVFPRLKPGAVMDLPGLVPLIIQVTPIPNLPFLLGLVDSEKDTDYGKYPTLDPMDRKARFEPELAGLDV